MMNRADYESIASAINEAEVPEVNKQVLALEIATALCATNDRFDPLRFLQQCDVRLLPEQISGYSHALFLRSQTGVGATRNAIRSSH
jgi:hypothetical protein